ncbi:MAG TPA: hypothetical protein DEO84_06980, partial [candidate division Zixibacteria bacterium]|nr:hypothetical protein [candidate division Zixibacteria bacterium]
MSAFIVQQAAAQLIHIPSNDPLSDQIEELQVRGYLSTLSQTERPWLVSDVVSAIEKDSSTFDPTSKAIALSILKRLKPPQKLESENLSAGMNGGIGLRALS